MGNQAASIRWFDLPGTGIRRASFDRHEKSLLVQFTNNAVHAFQQVPSAVVVDFLFCPSPGSFLASSIKSSFGATEIDATDPRFPIEATN